MGFDVVVCCHHALSKNDIMNPKVFVVTVCRNAGALLEGTLQSVLNQSYAEVEYVLVDGASTDGTAQLVADYAARHPQRIVYAVSEPDKGIYDAMNKALTWIAQRLEQSEECVRANAWVNFMNAGDAFADEEVLERIFGGESDRATSVKVIGGNTINLLADGRTEVHHAEGADVIPQRLPFSHQACFVRVGKGAPDLSRKGGWRFDGDYPIAADYHLLYQIYWKHGAEAFLVLDLPVARYRQEGSTSLDNAKRTKGEYLAIQSSHLSWRWVREYLKWRWL